MKLSEAIKEGAKLHPQTKCAFFDGHGTCALGAAYEAVKGKEGLKQLEDMTNDQAALEVFDLFGMDDIPVITPIDYYGNGLPVTRDLSRIIMRLNDREEWTREQIADWLDTLGL